LKKSLRLPATMSILLGLAGCGSLPSAGPDAGAMTADPAVNVVMVTPSLALSMAKTLEVQRKAKVNQALAELAAPVALTQTRFAPGDTLHVNLLTISPLSGDASGVGPTQLDLGSYMVDPNGEIDLPYAGEVRVGGLDVAETQNALSRQYAGLGMLQNPAVKVDVGEIPQGSVIVTGALGLPRILPWSPAGMTLAEALTQALGNGTELLNSTAAEGPSRSMAEVAVYRGDAAPIALPMDAALEQIIELKPGDRIVVSRSSPVRIAALGGGLNKSGEYDYAQPPTLAELLAQASGLNDNVANDHAVFVLRKAAVGTQATVYDFSWNKLDGMVAAQDFPIDNGDVVYVADAPIVPVQKVVGILFQLALPAQVMAAVP
jgi:polysaccharide biosynthesis/export protein